MANEELGRINRPEAGDILTRRKVYVVPLVHPAPGAPEGFEERFEKYWQAVDRQVTNLEQRAGSVAKVFVEGVPAWGADGLLMVQQTNPQAHRVIRDRVEAGAKFESFEDEDLFGQVVDWGRCLQVGLINRSVAETIRDNYIKASEGRQQHLEKRLAEGIEETEAALVLTSADNVKTPDDVERFFVAPPELDELERWIREVNEAIRRSEEGGEQQGQPPQQGQGQGDRPSSAGGGLWTPGSR